VPLLLPIMAFLCVSLLIAAGAMAMSPSANAIERRLDEVIGESTRPEGPTSTSVVPPVVMGWLRRLGAVAPRSTAETGKLQKRLVAAGYRGREAVVVFFGIRVVFAIAMFLLCVSPLVKRPSLILALAGCGVAYIVPGIVLARMAKRRQHRIRLGLPDALDLLIVSVEAGLGLDQAIQRVADELAFAHKDLTDELKLINFEIRAGKARAEALQNLASRTGLDDVASLVTMLVQTDKFGTSVAQALRVHADTLRTKRRQRAEEAAAKTGAKMVFPLVICIFPAIWVVTVGSVVIKFIQILVPMAQGMK
jgi:tight adherence protein C